MLLEFDLAGAEWVIVAYISGDSNMIGVVESGESPHVATGHLISRVSKELIIKEDELLKSATDPDLIRMIRESALPEIFDGDPFLPRSMTIRQAGKKSNHGLNYDMRYRRFALENEMPEADAKPIVELYRTVAYPGLLDYHKEVRDELKSNDRTLVNLLGRKVRLLDQPGPELWDSAYSFKPQSTVFDICRQAFMRVYHDDSPAVAPARLKANIHDSIMYSYPNDTSEDQVVEFCQRVRQYMSIPLVAKNRQFRLGVDVKRGPNWGAMEKFKLPEIDLEAMAA
jgi:DNA polymerase family A